MTRFIYSIFTAKEGIITTRDVEKMQQLLLTLVVSSTKIIIGISILISLGILGYLSVVISPTKYIHIYLLSTFVFLLLLPIASLQHKRRIKELMEAHPGCLEPYPEDIDISELSGEIRERYKKLSHLLIGYRPLVRLVMFPVLLPEVLIGGIFVVFFPSFSSLYPLVFVTHFYLYFIWYVYVRIPLVIQPKPQPTNKKNTAFIWVKNSVIIFLIFVSSGVLAFSAFKFGQQEAKIQNYYINTVKRGS